MLSIIPWLDRVDSFLVKTSYHISFIYKFLPLNYITSRGGYSKNGQSLLKGLASLFGGSPDRIDWQLTSSDRIYLLRIADESINHCFSILGSGLVQMPTIEWNKDIKSGFVWPTNVFYKKQRNKSEGTNADIKVPWEISRCHHLVWLAEAYRITKDNVYAEEVVFQIEDWIKKNKFCYSVNWTCAMEVGIRAVNWLYAIWLISDYVLSDSFLRTVSISLYQHGFFIYRNLEKSIPYSNNHYLSDIVSLMYIGSIFEDSSEGKKWKRFSISEYQKEIRVQVLPSGVSFENSISYHRLITEMVLYSFCMLNHKGVELSPDIRSRVLSLLKFVSDYSGNGLSPAPMVSDNDNGRFVPFMPRPFSDHSYLINSDSLEAQVVGYSSLLNCIKPLHRVSCYEDAGFIFLREKKVELIATNCGHYKYSDGNEISFGSHIHNDLLSFVLRIGGKEFIGDPGTSVYTSDIELRNQFRSVTKHNTVCFNGKEQNHLDLRRPFHMKNNVRTFPWQIIEVDSLLEARSSYELLDQSIVHSRSFRLHNNCLEIIDHFSSEESDQEASLFYHIAPGIRVYGDNNIYSMTNEDQILTLCVDSSDLFSSEVKDDTFAPSYGEIVKSETIVVSLSFRGASIVRTLFEWR